MNRIILCVLMGMTAIPCFSQFIISAEIRPKFEYRDGYRTLLSEDQKPAFVSAQRSRLNLSYNDDRIATRISVQDVRIWGEAQSKTDASTINVFEAWFEYSLTKEFSMRIGRQELSYDQNRLLGVSNWNDVGSSHDLFLMKYHRNFDFQLGLAYNNDKTKSFESNYPLNYYKTLGFIRGEKNIGRYLKGSVIVIADGNQMPESDNTIYQRYTYGGNLLFKNDSVKTKTYASFYLQDGKSSTGNDINAYFFSLNAEYSFSKKLAGIVAIDYFSGDNAFSDNQKQNSFNNLYGNGHSYYGYMDYFGAIDKDTKNGGLMDLYGRINYKLTKKTSSEFTCHYFSFTNEVMDSISSPGITKKAEPYLGTEFDLVLKYKPLPTIEFNFGYSVMLASSSMEILKGGDHTEWQNWAWAMITFRPEFLNTGINKNK